MAGSWLGADRVSGKRDGGQALLARGRRAYGGALYAAVAAMLRAPPVLVTVRVHGCDGSEVAHMITTTAWSAWEAIQSMSAGCTSGHVDTLSTMYIPKAFAEESPEAIADAVRLARIGELVTLANGVLEATPVPLLLEDNGAQRRLVGHLARANPQWRSYDPATEALVIFRPVDAYVSPSFYATKAEHGKVVPTWNYVTVHAYGPLVVHDDVDWVEALVRRLTDHHEAGRDPAWGVDDAPVAFTRAMLRAIVGIEVPITRMQAKWKLSQNRSEADIDGVIAGLRQASEGDRRLAAVTVARRGAAPDRT